MSFPALKTQSAKRLYSTLHLKSERRRVYLTIRSLKKGEYERYLYLLDIFAIIIFLKGLVIEAIADYQLAQFCKNKQAKTFIQTGLWRYSRHPNYFGEIMLWWGISLLIFLGTLNFFVFISPVIMQILITYVSGVPMLEKKFISYPGYREYQKTTNKILFWPFKTVRKIF